MLNDPEKRSNYDTYGTADLDFDQMNFDEFMEDFGMFEEFLEEFLAVFTPYNIVWYTRENVQLNG